MVRTRFNTPEFETAQTAPGDSYYAHESGPTKLFDITCTVGTVFSGGDVSPRVAAFQVIAEHSEGRRGEYRFPNQDGTETVLTVDEVGTPS